jgi:hypothetical protein
LKDSLDPQFHPRKAKLFVPGWCIGIAVGILTGCAGWWGMLISAKNLPWSPDALYIEAWVERKRDVVSNAETPKILLVGGSGVLYGISAGKLTESLGRTVVNLGIHAALPLDFLLDEVKRHASRGDMVILLLEYEYYNQDRSRLNDVSTKYLVACEPGFINRSSFAEKLRLALEVPGSVATAFLWAGRQEIEMERERIRRETLELIDASGDRSLEDRKSLTPGQQSALAALQAGSLANPADEFLFPVPEIADFVRWAREEGIQVVAGLPCTINFSDYKRALSGGRIEGIQSMFDKLGVQVVGNPEDSFLPLFYFYDSAYHLNAKGVAKRTEHFLASLFSLGELVPNSLFNDR